VPRASDSTAVSCCTPLPSTTDPTAISCPTRSAAPDTPTDGQASISARDDAPHARTCRQTSLLPPARPEPNCRARTSSRAALPRRTTQLSACAGTAPRSSCVRPRPAAACTGMDRAPSDTSNAAPSFSTTPAGYCADEQRGQQSSARCLVAPAVQPSMPEDQDAPTIADSSRRSPSMFPPEHPPVRSANHPLHRSQSFVISAPYKLQIAILGDPHTLSAHTTRLENTCHSKHCHPERSTCLRERRQVRSRRIPMSSTPASAVEGRSFHALTHTVSYPIARKVRGDL